MTRKHSANLRYVAAQTTNPTLRNRLLSAAEQAEAREREPWVRLNAFALDAVNHGVIRPLT